MTATPDVRLHDPLPGTGCQYAAAPSHDEVGEPVSAARTVTPEQVDLAVVQLRERRGRTAAEQMQAVLRALDLTVAPRNEHRR
ncbi:hypothetical protein ACU61A_03910 [Pseudonocardia sichuanensis]|uniref:Uncharacterized protein n=1 Tax=Pseudonocardia kunmingensis TaxID=630975 RepID=A0A543E1E1_9PSEU|nr:hypothetical protein [Pseudonocardia kunmingensis]TQM15392.1 hypothetical protein FB558_2176 [Pseudonocardia kunmingensis]